MDCYPYLYNKVLHKRHSCQRGGSQEIDSWLGKWNQCTLSTKLCGIDFRGGILSTTKSDSLGELGLYSGLKGVEKVWESANWIQMFKK
jgi:hypothetical protein